MDIETFDVNDDEKFRGFYEAFRDGELHERPGMPMWSEHAARAVFRQRDPTETMTAYIAVEQGRVVGTGILTVIHNSNLDKAFLSVTVPPQHRRRGIGTAIEAHLAGTSRDLGRTTLIAESHIPANRREDHAYRRFAERLGYAVANVEINRVLALPVSDEKLDRWEADAAPHHQDYRIATYLNGEMPDELLESYCDLLGQLALEAPTGDLDFEAEVVTIESFRSRQATNREAGLTIYATVAIDGQGQAVAHSVLGVPREDPGNAYQWATLVRREHRGHRLGLATKVRNLRAMQSAHPDRTRIHTQNSEINGPMVRINELMGFTPTEVCVEFQRFVPVETPGPVGGGTILQTRTRSMT